MRSSGGSLASRTSCPSRMTRQETASTDPVKRASVVYERPPTYRTWCSHAAHPNPSINSINLPPITIQVPTSSSVKGKDGEVLQLMAANKTSKTASTPRTRTTITIGIACGPVLATLMRRIPFICRSRTSYSSHRKINRISSMTWWIRYRISSTTWQTILECIQKRRSPWIKKWVSSDQILYSTFSILNTHLAFQTISLPQLLTINFYFVFSSDATERKQHFRDFQYVRLDSAK